MSHVRLALAPPAGFDKGPCLAWGWRQTSSNPFGVLSLRRYPGLTYSGSKKRAVLEGKGLVCTCGPSFYRLRN